MGVLVLVLCWGVGFGQPGFLDPTFGNGGKVTTDFNIGNTLAYSCAIQTDGKIIAVGHVANNFAAVRYNYDGSLDSSFGVFGKLQIRIGDAGDPTCNSVAIQTDGKIILGGTATFSGSYNAVLFRCNSNGSIDSSFGYNGLVKKDWGTGYSSNYDILIKPNGKILASGQGYIGTNNNFTQAFIAQYYPDGKLDSSFGQNGLATIGNYSSGIKMYNLSTGKILLTGSYSLTNSQLLDFGLFRFLQNGIIDSTFGTNGISFTDFSNKEDFAFSLAVQTDDKIILCGYENELLVQNIGLVRYNSNGTIDSSFGAYGKVKTSILNSSQNSGNSVFLQSDGKVLISASSAYYFMLLRYNSNGIIDSTFGNNGIVSTDFFGYQDIAYNAVVEPITNKIVIVGTCRNLSANSFGLARYQGYTFPLYLLTFTAKRANNSNLLNWTTAQEVNTDRFEIERSPNGRQFSKIGTVKANSNNGQYNYTDNNPFASPLSNPVGEGPEVRFYRLKMIDKDGQFTYSPIRQLTINHSQFTINIFPNPVHNKLQLQINSDKKTTLQLDIIAQDGKVVLRSKLSATEGAMLRSINVAALQNGTYFLRATYGSGEQSVVKFEKVQ